MKTSTLLAVVGCFVSFAAFTQHDHHAIESLFIEKGLYDFEVQLGITNHDYLNGPKIEFIDQQYQNFHDSIDIRLDQGEEISEAQFETEYANLVWQVQQDLATFEPFVPVQSAPRAPDGPCENMDFEQGDVSGWILSRGDVDGSAPYSYVNEVPAAPGAYHQILAGGNDPVTGIPCVNPLNGNFSVRLGNGTGTGARAARMTQTFLVDNTNYMFTYSYAVIFQSPGGHNLNELPYFTVRVTDGNGANVPCGEYSVIADGANAQNYQTTNWGGNVVLFQDWQTVFTNLSAFIGQNITIEFTSGDCSLTGHFGYAYIDASCGMQEVIASQYTICSGDATTLTAPPGASSYLWSNGATTQSTTVTAGGTYTCTLTPFQGGGCSIDLDITIIEYPEPTANFSSNTNAICPGDAITFTDQSTIPPPGVISTYQWDFGDGTITPASSGAISGVQNTSGTYLQPSHSFATSGTYTVQLTVATADGCTDVYTSTITVNPLPAVVAGPDQTVCDGGVVTLAGSGAVSYVWDQGVVDNVGFTPAVGNTTFTVTGTDANGCVNTDQVVVTVNPLPNVNAGIDQTVCDGEQVTLSGGGAVNYAWDNGVTNNTPFTPTVGNTTFTVTGTDANGCVNTDQVIVTVNPLPIINAGTDQTMCDGEQVILSGSGGVSYAWNNGVTDGVAFTPTVGTTNYTVVGTDANGCQNTDVVAITVNPLPAVVAGPNQTVCDGEQVTLSGAGAVSYTWDNGVTNNTPFTPAVGNTTFTVTGTDANGCVNTDQVVVTVNPLPNVNAGIDQTVCDGEQVTLSGAGAVNYTWDNGVTNNTPFTPAVGNTTFTVTGTDANGCVNTDQVMVTVNPLPIINAGADQTMCDGAQATVSGSGGVSYVWNNGVTDGVAFTPTVGTTNYTVVGTDANGCQNTDVVAITVNPLPAVVAGPDQTVCDGEQVTLSGAGAVNYTWDNGVTNNTPFTPAVGTTTYTVTGTDANGCVNTDQVVVTVNPLPNVNAGIDQTVCDGDQVTLSGAGAVNYTWDNGVTNNTPFTPAVGNTTFTVTGTDANGCVNTDQVMVTVNPLPIINAGTDQTMCDGAQATVSGSGGVSYAWNNGVTDGVAFTPPVGTTNYTVVGTDANGCQNTDVVAITVNPLPAVVAGPDQTVCQGNSVILAGSGAVSYTWNLGVLDGIPFVPTVGTTTYTVTGTDGNGCINTDQVDVIVNPLPNVNAGIDQTVCDGDQVTLSGAGAVNYAWTNGAIDGVPFTPAVGTITYTVTGNDGNGCFNTDQVTVTVHALPVINAGTDQTVCENTVVTLSGSGAISYTWNNGVLDGVAFQSPVGLTTYTVTGTDINGCQNTDMVDVNVNALPLVLAGPDVVVCDEASVTLSGAGATSYVWSGGITNGVPFVVPVGIYTYTVTGTDANGCQNDDVVQVTVNPNPVVDAGADQSLCEGELVTLTANGSTNLYWTGGYQDNVSFQQGLGTVTYIVNDFFTTGCTASDSVEVTIHPRPDVRSIGAEICEGEGVTLYGSGASTYTWNNGVIDGVEFFPTVSGDYSVIGTTIFGCQDSAVVKVIVRPLPFIDFKILKPSLMTSSSITGFDNLSVGAVNYTWNFGDGSPLNYQFEPIHEFPFDKPGTYEVILTGETEYGCIAEKLKYVYVLQDYLIYVPNTFTPDGNGKNELFKPVMDGFDEDNYTLYIFNRWGDLIFESHDIDNGWDGSFKNAERVQDGVFTWKIEAGLKDSADSKVFVGHVTLLK